MSLELVYVWILPWHWLNEIWGGQSHKSKNLGGHGPPGPLGSATYDVVGKTQHDSQPVEISEFMHDNVIPNIGTFDVQSVTIDHPVDVIEEQLCLMC